MLLINNTPASAPLRQDAVFLSKYAALLDILLRIGDVVIVLFAAFSCFWWCFRTFHMSAIYLSIQFSAILLVQLIFPIFHVYHSWRGQNILEGVIRLGLAWATVLGTLIVMEWVIKDSDDYSRVWLGGWFAVALFFLMVTRFAVRGVLGWIRLRGMDTRQIILVGATTAGSKILKATKARPWMGLKIVGYVATPYDQVNYGGVPCLGNVNVIDELLLEKVPDQLWIALPLRAESIIRRIMDATGDLPTQVRLVPDFFGYEMINHHSSTVAGIPIITMRGSPLNGHALILKAIEDRLLSAIFLTIASPLMMLVAVGVKLSSAGPIFYRQKRIGLDGREFEMLKFRSMPIDVETDGIQWGLANRKATSRFGRFIRRTSLDELPQFINVLKGDLSLVGPRPERPVFVEQFRKEIPGYMHKHLVKGGITGLAQINGWRGDSDLEKRIECDLQYIQNWSIWLDLRIILATPFSLLRYRNAY